MASVDLTTVDPASVKIVSTPPRGGSVDLTTVDPSTVKLISTPETHSPASRLVQGVKDAGAAALSGDVAGAAPLGPAGMGAALAAPAAKGILEYVGDKLERYVDSPFRAEIGALQNGGSLSEARQAGEEQFKHSWDAPAGTSQSMPSTPTAKAIMAKAGMSETPLSAVIPGAFSDDGYGLSLQKGGPLDVSPAGVYGGLIQPSMWAVPGGEVVEGLGKAAGPLAEFAGKAARAGTPIAEVAGKAGQAAKSGVFKVGEVLTGGALDAADALKASDELSGRQMIFPGTKNFGPLSKAGEAVGAARDAIATAQPMIPVVDAQPTLEKVKGILQEGERRALRSPQSQAVIEKIDTVLKTAQDTGKVPLQDVDDLVRNLDNVGYTDKGYERSLDPMWKGPVSQARSTLNGLLPAAPEGAALQAAKDPYAALSTVSKGRSKLMEGISRAGSALSLPLLGHGIANASPIEMATGALAAATTAAMSPSTYYKLIGFAKLPADGADMLMQAYQSGSAQAVRDAMATVADKYPTQMAKLTTAIADQVAAPSMVQQNQPDAIRRRIGE